MTIASYARQVARQLRAAGHLVYVTSDLGVEGQADELHLERATRLGAVLASQNQQHFSPLHHRWYASGRQHAGILLTHWIPIGERIECLERAARLLTPEAAANQFMILDWFETEEQGLWDSPRPQSALPTSRLHARMSSFRFTRRFL